MNMITREEFGKYARDLRRILSGDGINEEKQAELSEKMNALFVQNGTLENIVVKDIEYMENLSDALYRDNFYLFCEMRENKPTGIYQLIMNDCVLYCGKIDEINAAVKVLCGIAEIKESRRKIS